MQYIVPYGISGPSGLRKKPGHDPSASSVLHARRLALTYPYDGKQTPMREHPVFLAQYATGCCCRGCFYKWHHIAPGRQLTIKEQRYAVNVLMAWIEKEYLKYK